MGYLLHRLGLLGLDPVLSTLIGVPQSYASDREGLQLLVGSLLGHDASDQNNYNEDREAP